MAAAAASLLKQLSHWVSVIKSDPYTCGPELWQDIQALPSCLWKPNDVCYISLVAVIVALVSVLTVLMLLTLCVQGLCRIIRTWKKKSVLSTPLPSISKKLKQMELEEIEKRKNEKMKHEQSLKRSAGSVADELLDIFSESAIMYNRDTSLPEMGSRLEKYWYRVTSQETYDCYILSIGSVSEHFTCEFGIEDYVNQRLSDLRHPNIQTITEIRFLTRKGNKQVAIIQPCWEKGSLKDYIYKASPFQEWSHKYNKVTDGLPAKQVAHFGGQILEAVVYLYGRGLSPLGHIQTGNIYMESEDTCRVGGYENTLLKNRARLYRTCANFNCLEDIDIIMFGHVVYEMSTGRELTRLVPTEQDYTGVEDAGCREILQYIFAKKEDGRFKRGIIRIQSHWFFGGTGSVERIEPTRQVSKPKTAAAFLQKTRKLLKQH